jgi:uncharacterized protein (DUF2236 family)
MAVALSEVEPVAEEMARAAYPIDGEVLGKPDLDAQYARLREVADPVAGLFGPHSVMWQLVEPLPVLPFMLIQAGFIEGAVPKIWFGTEYSVTRSGDYGSRFHRSADSFLEWFVGDLEHALRRGRKIHGYHSRVGGVAPHAIGDLKAGQEYRATEQELLFLTALTQVIPLKYVYEALVRPLSPAEVAAYWQECKVFCQIFGIDPAHLPETWADMEAYWERAITSGQMEAPADGYSRYGPLLDQSALPFVTTWVVRWLISVQYNMLDDRIRRWFEPHIPLAKRRPVLTKVSVGGMRLLLRVLPTGLTANPRVRAARRRTGSLTSPGRLERWVASHLHHPFGDKQPSLTVPATPEADPRNSQALRLPAV